MTSVRSFSSAVPKNLTSGTKVVVILFVGGGFLQMYVTLEFLNCFSYC